jgi:hypothetical protein
MRFISLMAACALTFAVAAPAAAAPASPVGIAKADSAIVLAQAKKEEPKKTESVTQKVKETTKKATASVKETTKKATASVKRAWKRMTGYRFDVACLTQRTTCSETGKSKGDAQAKCIAKHPACWVESKK